MRKLLLIALVVSCYGFSQSETTQKHFDFFNAGGSVDILSDPGINLGVDLEYVNWFYAKVRFDFYDVQDTDLTSYNLSVGPNLKIRDKFRAYAGFKYGSIHNTSVPKDLRGFLGFELGLGLVPLKNGVSAGIEFSKNYVRKGGAPWDSAINLRIGYTLHFKNRV